MKRLLLAGGFALTAGMAWAQPADDDLAVVRRAVAIGEDAGTARRPAVTREASARQGGKPEWLRVRVQEKGAKRAKVSINVPLALAQALGEDFPVSWHCHEDGGRCRVKLSDVLKALESGQDLVEVDDEDTTVRVWVE